MTSRLEVTIVSLFPYSFVLTYLAVVTVLLLVLRRCPEWVHLGAVAIGVGVRIAQERSPLPLLAAAAGVVLLLLGVFVVGRLVSGVTLFTACVALAVAPLDYGWLGLASGLVVAAAVGLMRTVRHSGVARISLLTQETMGVFGVVGGSIGAPSLETLPNRESVAAADQGAQMKLPPYLLAGMLFTALLMAA